MLALGLIALSYGAALQLHGYGFLAVFAAGLTLRTVERKHTGKEPPPEELAVEAALKPDEIATYPDKAPAHMAGAILTINEQLERIVEIALVLVVAAALSPQYLHLERPGSSRSFSWSSARLQYGSDCSDRRSPHQSVASSPGLASGELDRSIT
jgi:hypothetical protein